jgi:hypothetical protein
MLERSSAAKYASPVFFENYNDFDVYVEDTATGYTKIFANLLSRAIDENVALERVFPLGARDQVISAAGDSLITTKNRKSIFIIDGDLYLLLGEREKLPENVICLPRYCIENFLFDEDALISLIDEENHNLSQARIRELLDYQGWINRSREPLKRLFIAYAVSQKLSTGIKTVSCGYSGICLNSAGEIDSNKVDENIDVIKTEIVCRFGLVQYIDAERTIVENIKNDVCFLETYVSAKDFSLPLLILRIKKISSTKPPTLNLKLRLSMKSNISPLKSVGARISHMLQSAAAEHA